MSRTKFERGYFSPEGLPAYMVVDTRHPYRPTGIVWKVTSRHGQRNGDWRYEFDGYWMQGPVLGVWLATRRDAGQALLAAIDRMLAGDPRWS